MNLNLSRAVAAAVLLWVAVPVSAQDPAVVAPEFYRCTFENEHARVCEVTFKPGATIAPHSHPQHLGHALTAGKLRIHTVGAEPVEMEVTPGQNVWIPAGTHHGTNIGDTELKLLVVEFKALAK